MEVKASLQQGCRQWQSFSTGTSIILLNANRTPTFLSSFLFRTRVEENTPFSTAGHVFGCKQCYLPCQDNNSRFQVSTQPTQPTSTRGPCIAKSKNIIRRYTTGRSSVRKIGRNLSSRIQYRRVTPLTGIMLRTDRLASKVDRYRFPRALACCGSETCVRIGKPDSSTRFLFRCCNMPSTAPLPMSP